MNLEKRLQGFEKLGNHIKDLNSKQINELSDKAASYNNWFTAVYVKNMLTSATYMLDRKKLGQWVSSYRLEPKKPKKIGVTMAGNIPMVGFHDLLCVLISGHQLHAKLSSQDPFLLSYLAKELVRIDPQFEEKIYFTDLLKGKDAMIATGSDNTARYFEYYFSKIPNIIRKNRSSCAILTGDETKETMTALGKDIFQYFGLGCRNVSKIYVPSGYNFDLLFNGLKQYSPVIDHHKYKNNYDYNKSIYLVNKEDHFDSGFLLLKESDQLVSPISVLFYEYYNDRQDLSQKLEKQKEKIQCIAAENSNYPGSIPIGKTQLPELWDYADHIDTLKFLEEI